MRVPALAVFSSEQLQLAAGREGLHHFSEPAGFGGMPLYGKVNRCRLIGVNNDGVTPHRHKTLFRSSSQPAALVFSDLQPR